MVDPKAYADVISRISQSRRWITILFTDIVDSTRHWAESGDLETRYRVEQHNQNLIPLVAAYDGELVKTIGDSIMASFADPENAVRAAIAMQHALHEVREKDPDFELKVRIGIHRGRAIVEEADVFGNTVNVAARIEAEAQGDEILISDSVAQSLDQERYYLSRRGSFIPRGKSNSVLLYRVSWWRSESLLTRVPSRRRSAGGLGRSVEMMLYPVCVAAALLAGAAELLPTLPSDLLRSRPGWLSLALNPSWTLENYPQPSLAVLLSLVVILAAPLLAASIRTFWLRGLRAGVAFVLGFALIQFAALSAPIYWPGQFRHTLQIEGLSLVELAEPDVIVRDRPSRDAASLVVLGPGHRLPLDQRALIRREGPWLRVALAPERFGWLPETAAGSGSGPRHRIVPARFRSVESRDLWALAWGATLSLAIFVRSARGDARHRSASV